ncbi:MAG TPA: hypothetical protein VEP49_16900 [Acidimicrobiia bacterium]|nr:hypothetical protein [Acidimicrobiia bacterium]
MAQGGAPRRPRTGVYVGLIVAGAGLVAAPFVFSMFDRAPAGGQMIDAFRPFMTRAQVDKFRGFLAEIGAADDQQRAVVDPAAVARLGTTAAEYAQRASYLRTFEQQWHGIDADMSDMLDRMQRNLGNYQGVDALPPFPAFPWFFVVPGVLVVGLAAAALVRGRRGRSTRGAAIAIVVLGLGLIAAPAVFQMFTRAPNGGEMIDDFRPLMTRAKLTTIQGYFITIGNGEAQMRTVALPAAALPPGAAPDVNRFVADWPRINREMSPLVGVMADNLDNFAAVDALPPFALFPWFFVIPGALIAGLGLLAMREPRRPAITHRHMGGSVSNATKPTVAAGALVVIALTAMLAGPAAAKSSKSTALVGTFEVTAAECAAGAPTNGSYFRMVQSGGDTTNGPFVPNADSSCSDKTYTALVPGTAGGLVTGKYQPQPNPPFDTSGNGTAAAILAPTKFFGVQFAVSTNKTDPQTGDAAKVPSLTVSYKGALSGNLSAFGVAYGKQQFNQGAPKPNGTKPTGTQGPTGTYSGKTGSFSLEWTSAIVGGPFDGFTGVWHLEGTFKKAKS